MIFLIDNFQYLQKSRSKKERANLDDYTDFFKSLEKYGVPLIIFSRLNKNEDPVTSRVPDRKYQKHPSKSFPQNIKDTHASRKESFVFPFKNIERF